MRNASRLILSSSTALRHLKSTIHYPGLHLNTASPSPRLAPLLKIGASMTSSKNVSENRQPDISKNGFQILREALRLRNPSSASSTWSNSILVSVDFEHSDSVITGFTNSKDCQVGLATLDTRDLWEKGRGNNIIKTYNLITGSSPYTNNALKMFRFRTSSVVEPADLRTKVQSIIPQGPHVVIISHYVGNELKILRALGVNLSAATSVGVDTQSVANEVFKSWNGPLHRLLSRLGCPFGHLHSGGNDANFTLRASLLLAIKNAENADGISNFLREVAVSPIPHPADPKPKAAKQKEKKEKKSRKPQAKSQGDRKQSQLSEEQARKKAAKQKEKKRKKKKKKHQAKSQSVKK